MRTKGETMSRTLFRGLMAVAILGSAPLMDAAEAVGQDATLEIYGNFRYSVNWAQAQGDSHWTGANNASRVGLQGGTERGDWEAFYHLEAGAHVDAEGAAFSPRFYLGGIRGPLGSLTVGRHSPAYKMPALQVDPFYDTSTLGVNANVPRTGVFAGASYGASPLANGWANRTVMYQTPEYSGLTGSAAVYMDPDGSPDYGIGATYAEAGFTLGLHYHEHRSGGRNWAQAGGIDHGLRGHATYQAEDWSAGVTAERVDLEGDETQHFLLAGGTLAPGEAARVSLAVGNVGSAGGLGAPSGTGIHAGAFYEVTSGAEAFALFSTAGLDDADDHHVASVGMSVDFGWSP